MLRSRKSTLGVAAALAALLLVLAALPASSAGGAGTNKLYQGQRLKAGQCLKETGYYNHTAKFCLDDYGVISLWHEGRICGTDGTTGNHTKIPNAYVTVKPSGNVVLHQYAGGPRLWASGTGDFPGGHLVLSVTQGDQAALAINVPGSAWFTFASCPQGSGL
jgi:hypothetical protein